jgi:hypothetical protein
MHHTAQAQGREMEGKYILLIGKERGRREAVNTYRPPFRNPIKEKKTGILLSKRPRKKREKNNNQREETKKSANVRVWYTFEF